MKNPRSLLVLLALSAVVALPNVSLAAKPNAPKSKVFTQYDKNKNGKLDAEEYAAVRADFTKSPKGELAKLDKNTDGTLSDEELAAFAPAKGKNHRSEADRVTKRTKRAEQKKQAPATTPPETK
jgi:hypothetical protein